MQARAKPAIGSISNRPFLEYHYASEEAPMTLQVALVGTDGIVLGSDRKENFTPPSPTLSDSVTTSSQGCKIFRDDSRGVMACWSGQNPAKEVARQVVKMPDADIQKPQAWVALANEVFDRESRKLGMDYAESEVILVTKNDLTTIHRIKVDRESLWVPVLDKAIAGHTANAAVYFTERFYPKDKKLPMADLIPLVAHTILDAGRANPYGIEGLEIVCCSREGLLSVTDNEISRLTEFSSRVESEIKRLLFRSCRVGDGLR
jgi:hypothetical protein